MKKNNIFILILSLLFLTSCDNVKSLYDNVKQKFFVASKSTVENEETSIDEIESIEYTINEEENKLLELYNQLYVVDEEYYDEDEENFNEDYESEEAEDDEGDIDNSNEATLENEENYEEEKENDEVENESEEEIETTKKEETIEDDNEDSELNDEDSNEEDLNEDEEISESGDSTNNEDYYEFSLDVNDDNFIRYAKNMVKDIYFNNEDVSINNYEIYIDDELMKIIKFEVSYENKTLNKYMVFSAEEGERVSLGDMCSNENALTTIKNEILLQMESEVSKNSEAIYYPLAKDSTYKDLIISENQNYYISEDKLLIIVFDEGEVASAETEFIIPREVFEPLLLEYYLQYFEEH